MCFAALNGVLTVLSAFWEVRHKDRWRPEIGGAEECVMGAKLSALGENDTALYVNGLRLPASKVRFK